jgi:hypothetical protein
VALAKTLNTLRQEPLNTPAINAGRATQLYTGPISSRPMTSRTTPRQNSGTTTSSNYYYQVSGGTKGPLPAELITRRPNIALTSNGIVHSRVSHGAGPLIVQQPTRSLDIGNTRVSTPLYAPTKSLDTVSHQLDAFNFNMVILDEHYDKARVNKEKGILVFF